MDQQQAQQVEQQLRQNWQQIRYRILDQFAQVTPSDVDAASNVNDLVQRIADKTHHSEQFVENRLQELATVGAGQQQAQQPQQPQQRFSSGGVGEQQQQQQKQQQQ
jgi:hypothetical protein